MNAAKAAGNVIISEHEVHRRGVADILQQLPDGENYFITIDLDGFDASVMPAVSNPEPGGLTYSEARDLLCGLAAKGRIVAMDGVEMVPEHDLTWDECLWHLPPDHQSASCHAGFRPASIPLAHISHER